jgi:hypothetical protein
MNRKNLTTAVLAGLAGAAGLAGTAQAVNLNADGVGQVLVYPYYTTNGGNQTVLSVVNTTGKAKAVKVRFLEGFNSREVLDFNLYMSKEDVWTAALYDNGGNPAMITFDTSCTVPYFNRGVDPDEDGVPEFVGGGFDFLDLAFTGDFEDGGPTDIQRAAEGHFEIIEMGTVEGGSATEKDITHVTHTKYVDDDPTKAVVGKWWAPGDCDQLTTNWTRLGGGGSYGDWTKETDATNPKASLFPATWDTPNDDGEGWAYTDTDRNSGGLFGGAAVINAENGTMFSYDAKAIQGFDKSDPSASEKSLHREPGTIHPSLDDGDQDDAWVFFGVPQNQAVELDYPRPVDAVSAVFMHENLMNEYTIETVASAATEWIITMPTKSFYVDELFLANDPRLQVSFYEPEAPGAAKCNFWEAGDANPYDPWNFGGTNFGTAPSNPTGWTDCDPTDNGPVYNGLALAPFTETFDGEACEVVDIQTWDREERTPEEDDPSGLRPPTVSPSLPQPCDPETEVCTTTVFKLCNEVNVIRMEDADAPGEGIFGTPDIGGDSLLILADPQYENGWARINLYNADTDHVDEAGLAGLPATGFAAQEFENNFVEGGSVKAFYGGLFGHKGNVRRVSSD